ncbi:hypothetical protein KKF84_08125 [Myxococcota bacterium]|nr:hypothetical protein [Myxococcota bacterium]MBU1535274.1 hypothetical protein [Myxococcota bacterium]
MRTIFPVLFISVLFTPLGCGKKNEDPVTSRQSPGASGLTPPLVVKNQTLRILQATVNLRHTRVENSFDFTIPGSRAAFDALYIAFQKTVGARFPKESIIKFWKRDGSFGVLFNKEKWSENIRCNIHRSDHRGVEAVSHRLILQNPALGIDFRFFFQPQDPKQDTIFQEIVRSLAK